ncbi:MAG: omptin family outer membrane protease [Rectinemataceae bacterium]
MISSAMARLGRGVPGKIALALLSMLAAGFGYAQESGGVNDGAWTFSAGTGLEVLYGTAYEYVYDNANGNKLSELDWDIKPLTALSSFARARTGNVEFGLSCEAGIPGASGSVADSDWLNEGTASPNFKTNYSESNVDAERLIDLTLSLGYIVDLAPESSLKLFVGFRYYDIAWSAHDGWYQYADNYTKSNPNGPYDPYTTGAIQPFYGLVSTYEQQYTAVVFGLSGNYRFSERFSVEGSLQISPAVSCTDVDNHILRSVTFTDTLSGGFLVEPELALEWSPTRVLGLRLSLKYTSISGLKGSDTETGNTGVTGEAVGEGQSIVYPNSAGAALSAFGAGISLELHV